MRVHGPSVATRAGKVKRRWGRARGRGAGELGCPATGCQLPCSPCPCPPLSVRTLTTASPERRSTFARMIVDDTPSGPAID
nr:hypothetical protein RVX_3043 [Nitratidesulfovibrio sp. HK-II]